MVKIQCPHCGKAFQLDPALIGPKGRQLKCSQCQQLFFQGPVAAAPPPRPAAPPPPPPPPPPRPAAKPAQMVVTEETLARAATHHGSEVDSLEEALGGLGKDDDSSFDSLGDLREIDLDDETLMAAKGKDGRLLDPEGDTYIGGFSDPGMMGEEIDLDADTVARKGGYGHEDDEDMDTQPGGRGGGLSQDEEDALANLGMGSGEIDLMPKPYDPDEDGLSSRFSEEDTEVRGRNRDRDRDRDEEEPDREEPEERPHRKKEKNKALPVIIAVLILILGGVAAIKFKFGEWWEFKKFDVQQAFRMSEVKGEWKEFKFAPVLVVTGKIENTRNIPEVLPIIQVSLLDETNKSLTSTKVIPGRVLTDKEMVTDDEKTLQSLIRLQAQLKEGETLPKLTKNRSADFQAIFINPPKNVRRYQVDMEAMVNKAKDAPGKGMMEFFQNRF